MASTGKRRKKPRRSRRRVWVKAHCRRRPEASWQRTERQRKEMGW